MADKNADYLRLLLGVIFIGVVLIRRNDEAHCALRL